MIKLYQALKDTYDIKRVNLLANLQRMENVLVKHDFKRVTTQEEIMWVLKFLDLRFVVKVGDLEEFTLQIKDSLEATGVLKSKGNKFMNWQNAPELEEMIMNYFLDGFTSLLDLKQVKHHFIDETEDTEEI